MSLLGYWMPCCRCDGFGFGDDRNNLRQTSRIDDFPYGPSEQTSSDAGSCDELRPSSF